MIKLNGLLMSALAIHNVAFSVITSAGPLPTGPADISVSYMTKAGMVEYEDAFGYTGGPPTNLGGNVKMFNSAGNSATSFGRRTSLLVNPAYSAALGSNETLMAHAFFKNDNNGDYFPGIMHDSDITVHIQNVHFAEPVNVVESTILFHTLWLAEQSDQLDNFYHHTHNIHALNDPFRNSDLFLASGLFSTDPANFVIGQDMVQYTITGDGTDTLSFEFTLPYMLMMNLEEEHHANHTVPDGLPAPHGFLEPFHFHFEYVVVPEPMTISLFLPAAAAIMAFRRRR